MNIILIGMPGCGKSTVGKILAKKLNAIFADTDSLIEEKAGMPVSEIFSTFGEDYFRRIETEIIVSLTSSEDYVIAAGGGAVLKEENIKAFKKTGKIVFLDCPENILLERLKKDSSRPLLAAQSPEEKSEKLKSLLSARLPLYQSCADLKVPSKNSEAAADEIIKLLFHNKH